MASGPLWLAAEGVEGAKPKRGGSNCKEAEANRESELD